MLSWRGSWYALNGVLYIKIYRLVCVFFACEISKIFNHPWKIIFYYTLPIFLNFITMKLILPSPSRFINGIDCYYTIIINWDMSSFPSHSRHFHYISVRFAFQLIKPTKNTARFVHSNADMFELKYLEIISLMFCL